MKRLNDLILDHFGVPRPGISSQLQPIQDQLLPSFIETARQVWLAASPMHRADDPVQNYLLEAMVQRQKDIQTLNGTLETLGVHDLLREAATSTDTTALSSLPVDSYEERLLRAVGHPASSAAIQETLRRVATEPGILAFSGAKLEKGVQACIYAQGNLNVVLGAPAPPTAAAVPPAAVPPAAVPPAATPQPAARRVGRLGFFGGLGKLFSGLVLLSGNALVIPAVAIGTLSGIPFFASLATGVGLVADGVDKLLPGG